MLSGSVFSTVRLFISASYTQNTRGSLFRERVGKRKIVKKEEKRERERQLLAGKQVPSIARDDGSLRITLQPYTRRALETNGVTFCNYTFRVDADFAQ